MPRKETAMNEMIERVARAILDDTPDWAGNTWDDRRGGDCRQTVREFLEKTYIGSHTEEIALCAARAAIEAMREPTDAMLATEEIQQTAVHRFMVRADKQIWQAMIDAALYDAA